MIVQPGNVFFYFRVAECAAIFLFFLGAVENCRRGKTFFSEYLMIVVYGLILEELDMRFFKSYEYGNGFSMMLGRVPISIALLWAVIVSGSMAVSDASGLPETVRPFFDALLAVWLDLSFDAIAIRAGFWHWTISLDQGWFGVPAGNFYAWMWVAFFFSVFARVLRMLYEKNKNWIWVYPVIPVFCYAFLFLQLNLVGFAGRLAGLITANQRLWLFAAHFGVFTIITAVNWPPKKSISARAAQENPAVQRGLSPVWPWSRLAIHLFFLFLFFHAGIFRAIPVLGAVAVLVMVADSILMRKICHA